MRYCIVNADNSIDNTIIYDGVAFFPLPEGQRLMPEADALALATPPADAPPPVDPPADAPPADAPTS